MFSLEKKAFCFSILSPPLFVTRSGALTIASPTGQPTFTAKQPFQSWCPLSLKLTYFPDPQSVQMKRFEIKHSVNNIRKTLGFSLREENSMLEMYTPHFDLKKFGTLTVKN